MFEAQEGAEDNMDLCIEDLKNINFNKKDILCGFSDSCSVLCTPQRTMPFPSLSCYVSLSELISPLQIQ